MCSIRAALSPDCSTEYKTTSNGRSLSTNCNADNRLAYRNSAPTARNGDWSADWVMAAADWGNALSLNSGISDDDASISRLLTQLIPETDSLNEFKPSISEALAVLSGCTLLSSALDSPFVHFWNYSTWVNGSTVDLVPLPQTQVFNATVATTTYQSGGNQTWQNGFYIVLALMFIFNICCLIYFALSKHLVTDFMEPQNMFCLSLLSPPDAAIEGACGSGPVGKHYSAKWGIKTDKSRDHSWFESTSSNIRGEATKHKRFLEQYGAANRV